VKTARRKARAGATKPPAALTFNYDDAQVRCVRSPIPHRSEYRIPLGVPHPERRGAGRLLGRRHPARRYGSYETTATRMVVDDVRVYQRVGRGGPSGRGKIPGDE
jgi:hypothetical protein